jgi:hypothetical protein
MFFCEDCGAKNLLNEGVIAGKTMQVRCQACQYLNTITISVPERVAAVDKPQGADAIASIVRPFLLFPGVQGCYVYQATNHQVVHVLALQARTEVLLELGAMMAANFVVASASFPDIQEQVIAIDNRRVLGRRVAGALYLILIASPLPASAEFLMALNLAVSKLLSCNALSCAG